jgi:hypothetical protein
MNGPRADGIRCVDTLGGPLVTCGGVETRDYAVAVEGAPQTGGEEGGFASDRFDFHVRELHTQLGLGLRELDATDALPNDDRRRT